jgi:phosphohistidine phosphatase
MKILTLVRHGKSERDEAPDLPDFERPLTARGRADCLIVAKKLLKSGIRPDRLISSPALRAITTAHAFAQVFGIPLPDIALNPHIYEASALTLLHIVRSFELEDNDVMVFGHNPGLSHLLRQLAAKTPLDEMPTCCAVRIEFSVKAWMQVKHDSGKVVQVVVPKELPTKN